MFIQYNLTFLKKAITFNFLFHAKSQTFMFSYINYQLHLYFKTTFILAAQREETTSKELIFVMVFLENILGLFYLPLTRTLSIRSITYLF